MCAHAHIFQLCSDARVQVQSRIIRFNQGFKFFQVNMIKKGMGVESVCRGVCIMTRNLSKVRKAVKTSR